MFWTRWQVTCEMFIFKAFWRSCWKNISGYIWHKLFIQTVKCSFFSHIIVDQSFCGALLTFSYFFTSRKNCLFRTRQQVNSAQTKIRSNYRGVQRNFAVAQTIELAKYHWKIAPNKILLIIVEDSRISPNYVCITFAQYCMVVLNIQAPQIRLCIRIDFEMRTGQRFLPLGYWRTLY